MNEHVESVTVEPIYWIGNGWSKRIGWVVSIVVHWQPLAEPTLQVFRFSKRRAWKMARMLVSQYPHRVLHRDEGGLTEESLRYTQHTRQKEH